jgi:hypothetical protein
MEDLNAGDLSIVALAKDNIAVQLTLRGRSNDRQPTRLLSPYFTSAVAAAAAANVPLELHFEQLEHFNSSTITVLIQLIQEARNKGVKLSFFYRQDLKWQKLSFDALKVFAKDGQLELRAL